MDVLDPGDGVCKLVVLSHRAQAERTVTWMAPWIARVGWALQHSDSHDVWLGFSLCPLQLLAFLACSFVALCSLKGLLVVSAGAASIFQCAARGTWQGAVESRLFRTDLGWQSFLCGLRLQCRSCRATISAWRLSWCSHAWQTSGSR